MGIALQRAWKKDTNWPGFPNGSPFILATPCLAQVGTLRGYGYTVYYFPDDDHQTAVPAQDHTPYSETPWPGEQPYPHGMAFDIMPHADPSMPTIAQIGAQYVNDRQAGVAGVAWLKYLNWTDGRNNCWHDSWQPGFKRTISSDRGHVHASCRTDYVNSSAAQGYDVIARIRGVEEYDSMVIFAMDEKTKLIYRCDGQRCTLVPDAELVTQTYVYGGGNGTDGWAELGAKAGAVGPFAIPAQPVRPGDARRSHLKIYTMGIFGSVESAPTTGVTPTQARDIARDEIGRSSNTPGT